MSDVLTSSLKVNTGDEERFSEQVSKSFNSSVGPCPQKTEKIKMRDINERKLPKNTFLVLEN